jgi:hypothetical protein
MGILGSAVVSKSKSFNSGAPAASVISIIPVVLQTTAGLLVMR